MLYSDPIASFHLPIPINDLPAAGAFSCSEVFFDKDLSTYE
jgi:hypothetical protein